VWRAAATTLTGLHFATTTVMTLVFRWLGLSQASQLPLPDLAKFVVFSNLSIVGMNVSLMWNSVGFYQIAKLCMIPASCLLEVVLDRVHYSRDTRLSIAVVLAGVAVCTVTDVSVNARGLVAAVVAVWSTALQQYVSSSVCLLRSCSGTDRLLVLCCCCSMFISSSASTLSTRSTCWATRRRRRQGRCCWQGRSLTTC
jgi:hypothetical protein